MRWKSYDEAVDLTRAAVSVFSPESFAGGAAATKSKRSSGLDGFTSRPRAVTSGYTARRASLTCIRT